jgi:RNA polymerase sigma factor (sigma-70 family)
MAAADRELDELVDRYEHRVHYFTAQVQKRFMLGERWRDDLVSAGYWGLLKALRNRRSDAHERELSAYVSRRVEGAVIDEARACLSRSSWTDATGDRRLHGLDGMADDGRDAFARSRALEDDEDPERLVAMQRRRSAIEAALDVLEPESLEVLRAYMDGDSISEIARDRGVSPGTMQVRFQKLARRVRAGAPSLRQILLDSDPA